MALRDLVEHLFDPACCITLILVLCLKHDTPVRYHRSLENLFFVVGQQREAIILYTSWLKSGTCSRIVHLLLLFKTFEHVSVLPVEY